jgi:hypothetical protein
MYAAARQPRGDSEMALDAPAARSGLGNSLDAHPRGPKSLAARLIPPDGVGPSLAPETVTSEPSSAPAWTGNSKIDRIVALASEAIRYVDQKKGNGG